jgi:hypothetical protein
LDRHFDKVKFLYFFWSVLDNFKFKETQKLDISFNSSRNFSVSSMIIGTCKNRK